MAYASPQDGICKPTGWHMQADEPPFGSRHEYAENATWVAHAEWWFIKRKLQRHNFDRPKFVNKEGKDYLCSSRVAASHPTPCRGEPRHNWPTTGIYIPCSWYVLIECPSNALLMRYSCFGPSQCAKNLPDQKSHTNLFIWKEILLSAKTFLIVQN